MENSGNILIFSDIYDTRSGRGCNVTLLTEDSQSLRDLADRAGIWTELEERHPGLTPERILQGDHAVFGCIVIHDNLRTHGEFGLEFAGAAEVAVYAKLPRGFQIPTPVGNYAPDWAVAFRDDSGLKHLFFVAETKGTLESFDLRGIENSKIACTKRLFNDLDLADGARYEQDNLPDPTRRGESPAVIKGNRCDGDESAMDIAITTFFVMHLS